MSIETTPQASIPLKKMIEHYGFKNFTPEIPLDDINITLWTLNRPSLQLAGYFGHFDYERVQLLGNTECDYIASLDEDVRNERIDKVCSYKSPCMIFAKNHVPSEMFLKYARKHGVPCVGSEKFTADIMAEATLWLKEELAPTITIHGVLMDVFGEGLLITGESGIGKSEAALELVKRGHRLVSDDVVQIKRINDDMLVGTAPDITKYLIEMRGIGVIDVKALYGVEAVKDSQEIDLEIHLEEWDKEREYDRLGLNDTYKEYLGTQIIYHGVPVRPGRNLAVICETAAVNRRQKKMGYNAAEELYRRVQSNLAKGKK
jgi:HPr kinase/phosphorylase